LQRGPDVAKQSKISMGVAVAALVLLFGLAFIPGAASSAADGLSWAGRTFIGEPLGALMDKIVSDNREERDQRRRERQQPKPTR
jgi:hypothetical protein